MRSYRGTVSTSLTLAGNLTARIERVAPIVDGIFVGAEDSRVMSDCVFCSIVAKDSPAYRLYEDEHSLAFLDIEPATRGHTLVIPKTHYETLTDMPKCLVGEVFQTVHRVSDALESVYQLDGFNVVQSNGKPLQEVFHAHVHVIPRYGDDALALGWSGEPTDETTQQEVAATVRDELASRS